VNRRVLSVFLASPGDMEAEREAVHEVVDRFNKSLGRQLDLQIDLLGWEDTLPGFERPQSLINKDVDACDLFIGMLWRRWGSNTKQYSSGFEEEFTVARTRHIETAQPEIWLYFKDIGGESLSDPGEQLKKVLQFISLQTEEKELTYRRFSETIEFKDKLYDTLIKYALRLSRQVEARSAASTEGVTRPSRKEVSTVLDNVKSGEPEGAEELFGMLSTVRAYIKEKGEVSLDFWQRARLNLLAVSLLSPQHIWELLGPHQQNLFYRKRKEWNLLPQEQALLIRSLVADDRGTQPGWFWLAKRDEKGISGLLIYLTLTDGNDAVRRNAFRWLRVSGQAPSSGFIKSSISEQDHVVLAEVLQLAELCEDQDITKDIEVLLDAKDANIRDAALEAYLTISFRADQAKAISLMTEKSTVVPKVMWKALKEGSLEAAETSLMSMLTEGSAEIREFACRALRKRGELSKGTAEHLLKDPDSRVRGIAVLALMEGGRSFNLEEISSLFEKFQKENLGLGLDRLRKPVMEDDIAPFMFEKWEYSQLKEYINYYDIQSAIAYRLLAQKHFDKFGVVVNRDLQDACQEFKRESASRLAGRFGLPAEKIITAYEKTDEFLASTFIGSAMEGMASHAVKDALPYARKYLGRFKYETADEQALLIFEQSGEESDVELLLRFAEKTNRDIMSDAVRIAITISGNREKLIRSVVFREDDAEVIASVVGIPYVGSSPTPDQLAIAALDHSGLLENKDARMEIAKEALKSNSESVRLSAVRVLHDVLDRAELENFLDEYIEREAYFYNVVSLMDALIYAPGAYGHHAAVKLSGESEIDDRVLALKGFPQ